MKTFLLWLRWICAISSIFFCGYFPVTVVVVADTIGGNSPEFHEYVNIMLSFLFLALLSILGYLIFTRKYREYK